MDILGAADLRFLMCARREIGFLGSETGHLTQQQLRSAHALVFARKCASEVLGECDLRCGSTILFAGRFWN